MFLAVLFILAKKRKPKFLSTAEQIKCGILAQHNTAQQEEKKPTAKHNIIKSHRHNVKPKKLDTKEDLLNDSVYLKVKNRQN